MDYSRKHLADALAAEYVTGTMRGGARRRFESLLPAHSALREATLAWSERLMPLTAALAPVEPSGDVCECCHALDGDDRGSDATSYETS